MTSLSSTPRFRRASVEDAELLTGIQTRSSSHWRYPDGFFDFAPGALETEADYLADNLVFLLDGKEGAIGFYALIKEEGRFVLDKLFVDLHHIGKGFGRRLWLHAVETTRSLGFRELAIGSDPNAAPFYAAMGATWLGEQPTPNPEWTVQLFRFDIPDPTIRPARRTEARSLHELTQRSAMSWGYEPEFLEWEPEAIAVTPEFLDQATTFVVEEGATVLGYYALVQKKDGLYLDKLFVEPERIGTGVGKRLWQHSVDTARNMDASQLLIQSDPNAAPFYRAMGAEWTGETRTTRPGWNLQEFRFPLQAR